MSLIWGYNWVLVKEAMRLVSPFDFSAIRTIGGGILLLGVLAWKGRPLRPRNIPMTLLVGLLCTTVSVGAATWALVEGGAGKMAILVYAMPFWLILMAWPLLGERPRGLQWLAVSLALNLAFVSFFATQRLRRPRPAPAFAPRSEFGLRADQDARVGEIVRSFKLSSIQFKEDILDKRVEIVEELGNPLCDPEKIAKKTDELNGLENQLNRDFIAALLKINDVLEPEQRLSMIYGLSRNWFFFDHHPGKGGLNE